MSSGVRGVPGCILRATGDCALAAGGRAAKVGSARKAAKVGSERNAAKVDSAAGAAAIGSAAGLVADAATVGSLLEACGADGSEEGGDALACA
jgi:hypothetical protein